MHQALKLLLDIQELDIKMIRLMRVKKQRQGELKQIEDLRVELKEQLNLKKEEIADLGKQINALEEKIVERLDKYKKLEAQQASIKKVEEFNALTQQMTAVEREKGALETQTSNIVDKKTSEEAIYIKIKDSLEASAINSEDLEKDIKIGIDKINSRSKPLEAAHDALVKIRVSEEPKFHGEPAAAGRSVPSFDPETRARALSIAFHLRPGSRRSRFGGLGRR